MLAALEQLDVLRRKVLADDADQPHRAEKAGRIREIGRRAAENPLADLRGRLNRVDGDRTNNEQRHNWVRSGKSG